MVMTLDLRWYLWETVFDHEGLLPSLTQDLTNKSF